MSSINPCYSAKDLTFVSSPLGEWDDATNTNSDKETIRSSGETSEFDTHLFTLDGEKFLDSLPRLCMAYQTPEHHLLRVKSISSTLQLQLLDYAWLAKLVVQNPKAIRHIIDPKEAGDTNEGGRLTLTAPKPARTNAALSE